MKYAFSDGVIKHNRYFLTDTENFQTVEKEQLLWLTSGQTLEHGHSNKLKCHTFFIAAAAIITVPASNSFCFCMLTKTLSNYPV